jgi:hypothetical protein
MGEKAPVAAAMSVRPEPTRHMVANATIDARCVASSDRCRLEDWPQLRGRPLILFAGQALASTSPNIIIRAFQDFRRCVGAVKNR